ncbi:LPD38 domain-containing protein [Blastomonas sp. UPD001]|uniref:LPD38 domain-containing protein n=1 Tax=Blastomonas sp. UPD001 TaxID=2217673 RepID=UPI000E3530DA|nr:LPD38 domain-containing protein [Blastomonas sp. UPD001]
MLTTVIDAFNPIGGTESLLNFISPTIGDPLVDLFRNRDFADRPIMPEQNPFGPPEPDAQRYFGSVAPHWKAVTDFLTMASGGDDVVPGEIDVSPETLEYMQGFVLGAAGGFADRLIGLGGKLVSTDPETEISANDFAFYRKVVGDVPPWQAKSSFYERLKEVELGLDRAKKYAEAERWEQFDAYVEQNADVLSLEAAAKAARKELRGIRKAKGTVQQAYDLGKIDEATYNSERAVYKQAEDLVISQFNTLWVAQVIKPAAP